MDSITQIFSQKNVEDMRDLERKTRHEIELKKEELRQMVGERYRDLIEAADTIAEMKVCSEHIRHSIKDLQQFCSNKSISNRKKVCLTKKQQSAKDIHRYMEIAAEAKVLMEMTEKIWSQVEAGHMINASFLYLQSLRVLKNLSLDGTTAYSPVLLWFPMLGQQAQAVGNLRTAILEECHSLLHDHLLHTDRLVEAVCSIILLEKVSISDSFSVLLKARSSVLRQSLSDDVVGSGSYRNVGAKARICDSATVIVQTVLQIFDLFCGEGNGLVAEMLTRCGEQSSHNTSGHFMGQNGASKIWSKHLPSDITMHLINLDSSELVISPEVVQSCSLSWLSECESQMNRGMRQLLKFTNTAKDLANIRTSLMEALAEANEEKEEAESNDKWEILDSDSANKSLSKWATRCKVIFNREVHLWKDMLQRIFTEKINSLVKYTFDNLLVQSKKVFSQFTEFPSEIGDIYTYVWQEHDGDISTNMAWNQWQTRKHNALETQGGLSLKALTVTPNIQHACKDINKLMMELLADLDHYVNGINTNRHGYNMPAFTAVKSSISQTEEFENKVVVEHLKSACFEFLNTLIAHINQVGEEMKRNNSNKQQNLQNKLDQPLHLSLVCRNFFELCYSFQHCCCPRESANVTNPLRRQLSGAGMSKSLHDASKDGAWNGILNDMAQQSQNFMSVWSNAVLDDAMGTYRMELIASSFNGNILQSMATWDSINVEEESETGDSVTSQIKIPASTTAYTQQLLYTLCSEVNRVGGYSASRFTLHGLSQGCLKGIYQAFSEVHRNMSTADANLHGQSRTSGDTTAPSQSWALQCLFDLRYVHSLLYNPPAINLDEEEEDPPLYTFTELVDWLEGYVDPFDLDVFSPHLSRNIQRHVTRTCVLFGILTSPDKSTSSSNQKFTSASKDSHNVLPLAPDCGRFSYLPVSGRNKNNRAMKPLDSSLTRQLPLANALRDLTRSSVNEDDKNSQENRLTSSLYSKLGALSTSWLSMSSSYTEG